MTAPFIKSSRKYKPVWPWFWINSAALDVVAMKCHEPGSAILIYLALQRIAYQGDNPEINGKSIPYIARTACMSPKTVERRLQDLERVGVISIQHHKVTTPTGQVRNEENGYCILYPPSVTVTPPLVPPCPYPAVTVFEHRVCVSEEVKKERISTPESKAPAVDPEHLKAMLHKQKTGQPKTQGAIHD